MFAALLMCGGVVACAIKFPPPSAAEMKEQRELELQEKLPAGCKVTDLGSFGEIDRMVAIQCSGNTVVTTLQVEKRLQTMGKVTQTVTDIDGTVNIIPEN